MASRAKGKEKKIKRGELLLKTITHGSTNEAIKLIKDKTGQDVKGYDDLEYKLAELYIKTPDKKELDKVLAELHPHKDFILKNLAPKKEEDKQIKESEEKHIEEVKKVSSADGFESLSSAAGEPTTINKDHTGLIMGIVGVIGVIGVIGIIGLFAYKTINKN